MTDRIILLDASEDSLTVSWPTVKGAAQYPLELRQASEATFSTLSTKLSQTQVRKRNLKPSTDYFFRVSANEKVWTQSQAFSTLPLGTTRLDAPSVVNAGSNHALLISWTPSGPVELQMRENIGGQDWNTISPSFDGAQVKKKNLSSKEGYQFRVRPINGLFSPPSEAKVAPGLSTGLSRWFQGLEQGTLLPHSNKGSPVPLADALGGKEFVLLYASAYQETKRLPTNPVEIIFVSCDHDSSGFESYFASHPWMAIDFDEDVREQVLGNMKVQGIPRLMVLSGKTGKILESDATRKPFDLNRWRNLDQ